LSARPTAKMFLAALTSRSWIVPHAAHVHWRTCSGLGPSFTPPLRETAGGRAKTPAGRSPKQSSPRTAITRMTGTVVTLIWLLHIGPYVLPSGQHAPAPAASRIDAYLAGRDDVTLCRPSRAALAWT
jgi:hypothetical protein